MIPAAVHQVENLIFTPVTGAYGFYSRLYYLQVCFCSLEKLVSTQGIVDTFLVEKGIALHDEKIADKAHYQTRRPAGYALAAEFFQALPDCRTKEIIDNQPVVGGSEIIGNLAIIWCAHNDNPGFWSLLLWCFT